MSLQLCNFADDNLRVSGPSQSAFADNNLIVPGPSQAAFADDNLGVPWPSQMASEELDSDDGMVRK